MVIANEECLELQFLGEVIGRCEFERGLCSNVDANKSLLLFIGVENDWRSGFGSHELKNRGREIEKGKKNGSAYSSNTIANEC